MRASRSVAVLALAAGELRRRLHVNKCIVVPRKRLGIPARRMAGDALRISRPRHEGRVVLFIRPALRQAVERVRVLGSLPDIVGVLVALAAGVRADESRAAGMSPSDSCSAGCRSLSRCTYFANNSLIDGACSNRLPLSSTSSNAASVRRPSERSPARRRLCPSGRLRGSASRRPALARGSPSSGPPAVTTA